MRAFGDNNNKSYEGNHKSCVLWCEARDLRFRREGQKKKELVWFEWILFLNFVFFDVG
jgi:hypothetical protein